MLATVLALGLELLGYVHAEEGGRPGWLSSTREGCSAFELCAVGAGAGTMAAQNAARAELAKIFRTEVQAKMRTTTSSKQEGFQGSVSEDTLMTVDEKTNGILQGAQIKHSYQDKDAYYALAALDKDKGAQIIKSELLNIDQKLKAHADSGTRYGVTQALRLYEERQALHWRYEFLSGSPLSPPVEYAELLKKKKEIAQKEVTVFLEVKTVKAPDEKRWARELTHLVAGQLLAQDFKIVTKSKSPHQAKVRVELTYEKMHFNVQGHERYKFLLSLSSANPQGEKKGLVSMDTTQTGRNFAQALENAMPELRNFVSERVQDLDID